MTTVNRHLEATLCLPRRAPSLPRRQPPKIPFAASQRRKKRNLMEVSDSVDDKSVQKKDASHHFSFDQEGVAFHGQDLRCDSDKNTSEEKAWFQDLSLLRSLRWTCSLRAVEASIAPLQPILCVIIFLLYSRDNMLMDMSCLGKGTLHILLS